MNLTDICTHHFAGNIKASPSFCSLNTHFQRNLQPIWSTFYAASINLHIKGAIQRRGGPAWASYSDGSYSLLELSHVLAAVGHLKKDSRGQRRIKIEDTLLTSSFNMHNSNAHNIKQDVDFKTPICWDSDNIKMQIQEIRWYWQMNVFNMKWTCYL